MRVDVLCLSLLLIFAASFDAPATEAVSSPQFSARDAAFIARNALLQTLLTRDPWLVRRILDLGVARAPTASGVAMSQRGATDMELEPRRRDAAGSVEWIELLTRARTERDALLKQGAVPADRSSEGSVELLDLMRRAKDIKAGR